MERSGAETARLGALVDPMMLQRVLLGQDPITAEQLVTAAGSSGRSTNKPSTRPVGDPAGLLTAEAAAELIGVDVSYVRRLAGKTATYRSTQTAPPTTSVTSTGAPTAGFLQASKVNGEWIIARREVERFIPTRRKPQVVIGYDITFSGAKSLSIVWATATPEVRALCEEAFEAGPKPSSSSSSSSPPTATPSPQQQHRPPAASTARPSPTGPAGSPPTPQSLPTQDEEDPRGCAPTQRAAHRHRTSTLGVTVRFMRRLIDERRIPYHKIGKYVRFDPADIDHFAIQGRVEPARR